MTFGSLFTGIGGLDLGLERAGFSCRWQVECNPFAMSILDKRWPSVPKWRDVKEFSGNEHGVANVDLVCGGDPCQGNSNAGSVHKREREDLAVHFLRIVAEIRPRFVLRENPSISRPDAPWPWDRFRTGLESIGYAVVPFRIRACCLGLEHRRDRLFLLAELPNSDRQRPQRIDGQGMQEENAFGAGRSRNRRTWHSLSAPRVCRGSDGIPDRMDRLVSIGNAVPPAMGEMIGRLLMQSVNVRSVR